jgi:IS4 transposase
MSLAGKYVERIRITAERMHDRKGIQLGEWIRDRLVVFDLGFFDYGLLHKIVDLGGGFITRLKESANGVIQTVRIGCSPRAVGKELNRVYFGGAVIDLHVKFGRGADATTFRTIGLWDSSARDYHWYITSLSPTEFAPEEIGQIYRLRWQIELMFKEWKSLGRIEELTTQKEEIVLCLVYAALCAMLFSRIAMLLACRQNRLPWNSLSTYLVVTLLTHLAREFAEALTRGRSKAFAACLDSFTDAISVHARYPNKGTALQRLTNKRS